MEAFITHGGLWPLPASLGAENDSLEDGLQSWQIFCEKKYRFIPVFFFINSLQRFPGKRENSVEKHVTEHRYIFGKIKPPMAEFHRGWEVALASLSGKKQNHYNHYSTI